MGEFTAKPEWIKLRGCALPESKLKLNLLEQEKAAVENRLREFSDVDEKFNQLSRWRREEKELAEKKKKHEELNSGLVLLQEAVSKLENEFQVQLEVMTRRWDEERLKSANKQELDTERQNALRELNKFTKLREQQFELRDRGVETKCKCEFLETQIEKKKTPELESELITGRARLTELRTEYLRLENEIKQIPNVERQLATLNLLLGEAKSAEKNSLVLKEQIDKLKMKLSAKLFARRELQAIEELKRQIQLNGYDEGRMTELTENIRANIYLEGMKMMSDFLKARRDEIGREIQTLQTSQA